MLNQEAERAHKISNMFQTAVMIAGIGVLLALSTVLILGWYGILITAAVIVILLLLNMRTSPRIIMRMYNGQLAAKVGGKQLVHITAELAHRAELEHVPDIYIIPSMTLNAFAAGYKGNAVIGVTQGLLRKLEMRELIGIIAHEVSHINNNDLFVMGLADLMSRLTQILSYTATLLVLLNVTSIFLNGEAAYNWLGILILYLAPAVTSLLQLGLSRVREYDADLEAARLTGDPKSLAQALSKLEHYRGHIWQDLMLPCLARKVPQPSMLRTHPKTEHRIRRLLQLKPQQTWPVLAIVDEPMISMVGLGPISMRPRYRFPGVWY